ncbi:MAG: hypothetical protein ABJA02_09230 [Acidobacteriota bacterium]
MRRTITISVSDEMYKLIHDATRQGYHSTVSEYIRFLVRRDRRPSSVIEEQPVYQPVQTMNQWMEDAAREREVVDEV